MSSAAMVACVLLVLLIIFSGVLLNYLKQEDRLALRISEVQRRAMSQPELETPVELTGVLQPVAVLGAFIALQDLVRHA